MKGKSKCKILKDIRRKIAQDNDIEFITTECKHKGDCLGTCPKCEAEVRYLEEQLEKRKAAGKQVAVAGIAAAFVVGGTSCDILETLIPIQGDMAPPEESMHEIVNGEMPSENSEYVTMGVILPPEESEVSEEERDENSEGYAEMGELPEESYEVTMGDVAEDFFDDK